MYRIKNIFHFFKVIWNFRSWEYTDTLRVLKACLELQHNDMQKYSQHENKEETSADIDMCIVHINNYLTDRAHWEAVSKSGTTEDRIFKILKLMFNNNTISPKKPHTTLTKAETEYLSIYMKTKHERSKYHFESIFDSLKDNMEKFWY